MAALSVYLLLTWMFLLSLFHTRFAEELCHADESSALMEFKRSFRTITTDRRCVYPKVHSWSLDGSGDCCSWDGVKCDEVTGRVIALNLSSSCLSGNMSPNTTLFRLVHVESLNLAYNSFGFSPIPYGFSNLSRLQYLNLSYSDFSGEIPHDILQLSGLVSLDLSASWDLTLHLPNMGNFVHNLTGLKELDLSSVSLSAPIPPVLANFSSLTSLWLAFCGLNGDFPVSIFQLPNLEVLHIGGNSNLSGFFPKPHWGSPLKSIYLYNTNFSGEIPASIGNLSLLNELYASDCHFLGSLPSSLGNLSHLTALVLDGNKLQGQIPISFADLTQLSELRLSFNNLSVDTLEWVVNLTKLTDLEISGNSFFPSVSLVGSLFLSLQLHGTTDLSSSTLLAPSPITTKTPRRDGHKQNQKQGLPPLAQGLPRQARRHEDHPLLLPPARNPAPSIDDRHSGVLSKISVWAEFVGYIRSVNLQIRDLRRLREDEACVKSSIEVATSRGIDCEEEELKLRKLREKKLMMKKLSVVQDLAELAEPEGLPAQAVAGLEALEAAMVVLLVVVAARVLVVVGEGGSGGGAREIGGSMELERERRKGMRPEPAERRRGRETFPIF